MEGRFAIDHSKLSLLRVINNPDKRGAAGMNGIVHLCQYVDQVRRGDVLRHDWPGTFFSFFSSFDASEACFAV